MLLPAQLILGKTAAVVYVQRCGGTAPHNDNHSISREREKDHQLAPNHLDRAQWVSIQ